MKARLAELQANRRNIYRQVGQHVYQILAEIEENHLGRARRALFGDEQSGAYDMLANRIAFVESGRDDCVVSGAIRSAGKLSAGRGPLRDSQRFLARFPARAQSGAAAGAAR